MCKQQSSSNALTYMPPQKRRQTAGSGRLASLATTTTEANKTLTRRYFESYSAGAIDAVMRFMDPHHVLHPGGGGEPVSFEARKRDEAAFFKAFSNIQAVVNDQIAEGDRVVSRITTHCTHTGKYQGILPTGKRIAIDYIDIAVVKSGKIVEEWVEYDMMSILRQISPPKERH